MPIRAGRICLGMQMRGELAISRWTPGRLYTVFLLVCSSRASMLLAQKKRRCFPALTFFGTTFYFYLIFSFFASMLVFLAFPLPYIFSFWSFWSFLLSFFVFLFLFLFFFPSFVFFRFVLFSLSCFFYLSFFQFFVSFSYPIAAILPCVSGNIVCYPI